MLFSEPKIPQCQHAPEARVMKVSFSALQRAENSSIDAQRIEAEGVAGVSVLFSEPKIPQSRAVPLCWMVIACFSALQRAENSSIFGVVFHLEEEEGFSALQRAENSSIPTLAPASIHIPDCDDHASSFLSLPGASP